MVLKINIELEYSFPVLICHCLQFCSGGSALVAAVAMRLADPELGGHGAPWEQLIALPGSVPAEAVPPAPNPRIAWKLRTRWRHLPQDPLL